MKRRKRPNDPPGDYAVGYGKPPVATRFQKGKSGNPNGRPRKTTASKQPGQSLTNAVLDLARQTVTVREGEDHRQISGREVVLKFIMKSAASGNSRAQRHLMELFAEAEAAEAARIEEEHRAWTRYVEVKRAEIADCARRGVAPPRMVPHPDDIFILDGEPVVFVGPRTELEADDLDRLARFNDALLLHFVWETGALPSNAETGLNRLSLAGIFFYHINPTLPPRMRLSEDEIRRRTEQAMFSRRRREHEMLMEAWAKVFPGFKINSKFEPMMMTAEFLVRMGFEQSVIDNLAQKFDLATTS